MKVDPREVPASLVSPQEKVQKALMWLVLHKPFYGALILRLTVAPSSIAKTCYTNGSGLYYNREFVARLSFGALITVLAHEVMHCALLHPWRRGERDLKLWNDACDHAVNLLLKGEEEGFEFPGPEFGSYCADRRFDGQSVEQIYSALALEQPPQPQPQPQPQSGGEGSGSEGEKSGKSSKKKKSDDDSSEQDEQPGEEGSSDDSEEPSEQEKKDEGEGDEGDGKEQEPEKQAQQQGSDKSEQQDPSTTEQPPQEAQPGSSMGDVMDARGDEAEQKSGQEDWSAAVAAAVMQAEMAGHLSAGAVRAVREQFAPQTDFSDYLRLFLARISRDEQSWARPSRRSEAAGAYLPTQRAEATGKLVIGIDTSGSIGERQLAVFESELRAVHADLRPEELVVVYCDSAVCNEERIGPHDEVRFGRPKGGGGTDFRPVFARVRELQDEGEQIAGLIYLTDLDGSFPAPEEVDPDLSVLWVRTRAIEPPFGEVTTLRIGR